jgi:branched-chain amino acid transport system ATP-binding protein
VNLSAENLKVRYSNQALGIADVSLDVGAGQIVMVFGPNGAGKTTTVRAISGFMKSEGARVVSGRVTLFGEDTTNAEPQRTTGLGVAFIPERRKIFASMTVAENLQALGKRPPRSRRNEIYERIYALFPVLAERRKSLAGRLSGGQQQMLAIGRSLMCEPRLLIIDEMTLGLHHSVHLPLFEAVKSISDTGTGVLIVDESTTCALDFADKCYVLGGGRVHMVGSPDLLRNNALVAPDYEELEA